MNIGYIGYILITNNSIKTIYNIHLVSDMRTKHDEPTSDTIRRRIQSESRYNPSTKHNQHTVYNTYMVNTRTHTISINITLHIGYNPTPDTIRCRIQSDTGYNPTPDTIRHRIQPGAGYNPNAESPTDYLRLLILGDTLLTFSRPFEMDRETVGPSLTTMQCHHRPTIGNVVS